MMRDGAQTIGKHLEDRGVIRIAQACRDSTSASSTLCRSRAERLMTFKTSAVAVCCSGASYSSRLLACSASKRRVFSMAMTAWSAKVLTREICVGEYGSGCRRIRAKTPIG
jgi:hypothetical protein